MAEHDHVAVLRSMLEECESCVRSNEAKGTTAHSDTLAELAALRHALSACVDAERLDALQWHIDKHGGIVLHNGTYAGNYGGLGLANTKRTLREGLDECVLYRTGLAARQQEKGNG